jgi:O-methyltransferase
MKFFSRRNGTRSAMASLSCQEKYLALMQRQVMNLPPVHLLQYSSDASTIRCAIQDKRELQELGEKLLGVVKEPHQLTMIGVPRLRQLDKAIRDLIDRGVPGDLLEAGVWRGGACLYMRAALDAFGDTTRKVWLCDSGEAGFPRPKENCPWDASDNRSQHWIANCSMKMVQRYFEDYGYLDDQVQFVDGFFSDTLPSIPVKQLALLRSDCDMYGSTMEALELLYDKVSIGGYIVVDDYGITQAKAATDNFRASRDIRTPLQRIDFTGVYWIKEG